MVKDKRKMSRTDPETVGTHNQFLEKMKQKIGASAMSQVEKMQFNNMIEEISARALALDVESYINKILFDKIKGTDASIVDYEADLLASQLKLANQETQLQFHRKVLNNLKEEYLQCTDEERKIELLGQIDIREDAIAKFERLTNDTIDLRNKIRKEIDKNNFNEQSLKLREKAVSAENAKVIDVKSIDFDIIGNNSTNN